jgi:hypothetical protein
MSDDRDWRILLVDAFAPQMTEAGGAEMCLAPRLHS